MHGQVDGIASKDPIIKPIIVPFFLTKKPKQITHVAACRSRSVAVSDEGQVFVWGYLGDEN